MTTEVLIDYLSHDRLIDKEKSHIIVKFVVVNTNILVHSTSPYAAEALLLLCFVLVCSD